MPTQPTADEQYLLELVNIERAKAGVQPLAFDLNLNSAADSHTAWMLATDTFSHSGAGSSNVGDRIEAAGYTGWNTWAENIAMQSVGGPAGLRDEADRMHVGLMNSPGHRANILNGNLREIGIGLQSGEYKGGTAAMVTEVFGRQGGPAILTGVAFKDADGDKGYDPGEGLGNVTVKVTGSGGSFTTQTMATGGYQLDLAAGSWTVTFSGNGVSQTRQVTMGTQNLKLDASGTGATPAPEPEPTPTPTPPPAPAPEPDSLLDLPYSQTATTTRLGTSGNDRLYGTDGHNLIDGKAGQDYLSGGRGDDTYRVDSTGDTVVEGRGKGVDTVLSKASWHQLSAHVENLFLQGDTMQVGIGNSMGNILKGNGVASYLDGGAGDDVLVASKGSQTLKGGAGDDQFVFETAGSGRRVTDFEPGEDQIDLRDLFEDFDGGVPALGKHVLLKANTVGGTEIRVDLDGAGGAAPSLVATLDQVAPADLQAGRDLIWS
ncbi:CAP domain-containing protein [Geminicoccus flavidas]|uniref:CAP domain-containing protein n=1 Tax=Geminicoccus flavidas TaxID=2506407 RepID=UPI00135BAD46|nr:CAP domain-containing protein [Geminicoccus flavidas]